MVYAIFEVEKAKVAKTNDILKDDVVSRQSISIRDASGVGIDRNVQFIVIDGDPAALARAEKLFKGEMKPDLRIYGIAPAPAKPDEKTEEIAKRLPDAEAKGIYDKIKAQEESSECGMGMVFG